MKLKFACRITHSRNCGNAKCNTEKTTWIQVVRNSLWQNSKKQRGKRVTKSIVLRNQQQQSLNPQSSSKLLNNWQSCARKKNLIGPRQKQGHLNINEWILVFYEGTPRERYGSAKRGLSLLKEYHWRLRRKTSILMTCHFTDLGRSLSFCKGKFPQPIRSNTQFCIVTRYRYGISSAPVSQTSFARKLAVASQEVGCFLISEAKTD